MSHLQGQRDEVLIWCLPEDAITRLINHYELLLFTDEEASYASLSPQNFGQAYRPSRQGNCGRFPEMRYRIPRVPIMVLTLTDHIWSIHDLLLTKMFPLVGTR